MRRPWHLAITCIIAAALAALTMTTAAAAGAVLTVGSTSGPPAAVGDVLWGVLSGNATFVNSSNSGQKVTCTSSRIDAVVVSNTGPAMLTVTSLTFGGCSISGVTGATGINSITTNASASCPWNARVDDTTSPAKVTISPSTASGCPTSISATVTVQTIFGAQNCVYSPTGGSITGTSAEGSTSLVFSGVGFSKTSGPGTCFGTANFTATYNFTDHTQGGGAVFTN